MRWPSASTADALNAANSFDSVVSYPSVSTLASRSSFEAM